MTRVAVDRETSRAIPLTTESLTAACNRGCCESSVTGGLGRERHNEAKCVLMTCREGFKARAKRSGQIARRTRNEQELLLISGVL